MKQHNTNYVDIPYTKEARSLLRDKNKVLYSPEDGVILEIKNSGYDLSLSYGQVVSILCVDIPFNNDPETSYFVDKYSGALIKDLDKHKDLCDKKYLLLKRKAIDHIIEIKAMDTLGLDTENDLNDITLLKEYLLKLKEEKNSKNYPLNIKWPTYPLEAACQ